MKKILVIVFYFTAFNFLMAENVIIRVNEPGQEIIHWTRAENLDHTYLPTENSLYIYLDEEMLSEPVFLWFGVYIAYMRIINYYFRKLKTIFSIIRLFSGVS